MVDKLIAKVQPPESVRVNDWAAVEDKMGTALPADYKALVDVYGNGSFDDFIGLLVPDAPHEYLELLSMRRIARSSLRQVVGDDVADLPPQVQNIDDLTIWGTTDNGDCCYWISHGEPDIWTIAINDSEAVDWNFFDMTISEFLYKVLFRGLPCDIFPDSFPMAPLTFRFFE